VEGEKQTVVEEVVKLAVSLPLTADEFTAQRQTAFRESMAEAALVASTDVLIDSIEDIAARRRRLLAGSIKVTSRVKTSDVAVVSGSLTAERINTQLASKGLPAAEVIDTPKVVRVTLVRIDWTMGFSAQEADQKLDVNDGDVVEFTWPASSTHNVYLLKVKSRSQPACKPSKNSQDDIRKPNVAGERYRWGK
jgi:plastocyanin